MGVELGLKDFEKILKGLNGDDVCKKESIDFVSNIIKRMSIKTFIYERKKEWISNYVRNNETKNIKLKHLFDSDLWTYEECINKRIWDWEEHLGHHWDSKKEEVVENIGGFNCLLDDNYRLELLQYLNEKVKEDIGAIGF